MRIVVVSLLGLALSGCRFWECEAMPCANAITVHVLDAADGGPITDAEVNGVPCSGVCQARFPDGGVIFQAGTFELLAEAPGYRESALEVFVPATTPSDNHCCPISYVPQVRDVVLQPL